MPLARRLADLGAWLHATRLLWNAQPFKVLPAPWEETLPEVSRWARSLTPDDLERWESRPTEHPDCPPVMRRWVETAQELAAVPELDAAPLPSRAEDRRWIGGRKWSQLEAFCGVVLPELQGLDRVVEWCSGKGPLARVLARWGGCEVVGVERRAALCHEGERLARKRDLPVTLLEADVVGQPERLPDVAGGGLVALHACGSLTDAALDHAHDGQARLVAVAACCLMSRSEPVYPVRSAIGRACGLELERSDLYLAMAAEVVANPRLRQRRRRELAWRHALDLALREANGLQDYTRMPSVTGSTFDGAFRDFAELLAAREGLALPRPFDADAWEARGRQRSLLARALGTVRGVFGRALEVWVALDRAQGLVEGGWEVRLGTFCPVEVTPRNLLLLGRR